MQREVCSLTSSMENAWVWTKNGIAKGCLNQWWNGIVEWSTGMTFHHKNLTFWAYS